MWYSRAYWSPHIRAGQEWEVLVSGTVRDLVAGSELQFGERGLHELKGVPRRWPLFSVGGVG